MVQVLSDPTHQQHQQHQQHAGHTATPDNGETAWSSAELQNQDSNDAVMSRDEHAQRMRELNMKRALTKTPRRGWSMTEYHGNDSVPLPPQTALFELQAAIPEHVPLPSTPMTPVPNQSARVTQMPSRPKAPPPRRSYSVTDYEPVPPNQPKPSSRLTLLDLPSELHYLFFDFLDPIDSVCFGLAHSRLYAIHRRKHPYTVPLSSRYVGPNDMEWVWRGAGALIRSNASSASLASDASSSSSSSSIKTASATPSQDELARMRVHGQVYCRKCGIARCELHRHLREWFPGREYCQIREVYCTPAPEGARSYCYLSSPKNPYRCGRHGVKKT